MTIVYDETLDGLPVFEKCYMVRFNLFNYVHSDICVRVDGTIEICKSLDPVIEKFNKGNYKLALMPHARYNLIDEYNAWVSARGYPRERAQSIVDLLVAKTKYDFSFKGAAELTICIERKCKQVQDLDRMVFAFLKYLGTEEDGIERIDQIIYSIILNRYFQDLPIMLIFNHIFLGSSYMKLYHHTHENNDEAYELEVPYDQNKEYYAWFFNQQRKLDFLN